MARSSTSTTRRRSGAKYDLVNAYGLRGAGIWALGYDGTRPELWNAIQAKFITDTTPPTGRDRPACRRRQPNPGFTVDLDRAPTTSAISSYDVQASVDGGAWRSWLSGTTATSAVWSGVDGHAYAFRVRARDVRRATRRLERRLAPRGDAGAALAAGGFGRVRVDGLAVRAAPDTSASPARAACRRATVVAIVGGPRSADGYDLVPGRRADLRVVRDRPAVSAAGWPSGRGSRARRAGKARRTRSASRRRSAASTWNGPARPASASTAAAIGQRAFSPNGDRSKDAIRDRLDQRPDAGPPRPARLPRGRDARRRGPGPPARRRATGRRPGTGPSAAGGCRTAATSSRSSDAPGGATLYNPAFGFQAASLAALRRDGRHRRPDRPIGVDQRAASCRRTATASATPSDGHLRHRRAPRAGPSASRPSRGSRSARRS